MPVTLLATSLERKGLPDITSATELGQYLAHGIFSAGEFMAHARWVLDNSVNDLIIFQRDSCLYRTNCTFVPPLNVLVTLKVATPVWNILLPTTSRIHTLQFNRAEVVQESLVIGTSSHVSTWPAQAWIKMYVDETVPGLTPKDDRLHLNLPQLNHTVHQYLKMSGAFDSDRPFWKDRNTKMDEFLESQRERKHICTLTNQERVNFTWNDDLATTFNPSQSSADQLPDQSNGWTVFREWKLLDGEDLIVNDDANGVQDLVIQETGIYELHFNVFFYASLFNYAENLGNNHFATRGALNVAVSEYLHSNANNRSIAAAHYGPIEDWVFSSNITTLDGLFEDYTLLSDYALTQISLKWDVSNISLFTDMFKGNKKYGISAVLAINDAWVNNIYWSQTTANLRTAPFETRQQVVDAIDLWNTSVTYDDTYGNITAWEFKSTLTDFSGLFYREAIPHLASFNEDISGWDVSNVTLMSSMFKDCSSFNQDISSWNVSSVTDMSSMFEGCTDFRQNLQDWAGHTPGGSPPPIPSSISQVTSFVDMFKGSGEWDVDLVVAISSNWYLHTGANWPYSTTGSNWSQTAANLVTAPFRTRDQLIDAIDHWNDSSSVATATYGSITAWEFDPILTDFSGLFYREPTPLTSFNEDISGWNVSNVTTMSSMFKGCSSFNQDINSVGNAWNVSGVTDMSSMFEGCSLFNGNITDWDTYSVTNMSSMFKDCPVFNRAIKTYPPFAEDAVWNVSGVTDMSSMFEGCSIFNANISDWDVLNVLDMSLMFKGCSNMDQDLSGWNVAKVEDMTSMFENCGLSGYIYTYDLSSWDVSSVGVTAVDNTELWSVDYVFQITSGYLPSGVEDPVSGDDDGSSWIGPGSVQSDLIYKTFTGQDGPWNKIVLNSAGTAYNQTAFVTDKYTLHEVESCLQDGSGIYKAKSNVTHIVNTEELPHQTYSPRQSGFDKGFAGFDVLSTRDSYSSPTLTFEFRNLPTTGTYKLRLYGQPHTHNTGITEIYNHATFSIQPQTVIHTLHTSSTLGYVTFSNLSLSNATNWASGTLEFKMGPDTGQSVFSVGGVQLKRTYQVSRFKDMFKNSSWAETTNGTVVDNIDSQWRDKNANWWKNEAKLSKS